MVAQAVRSWNPPAVLGTNADVGRIPSAPLEGAWIDHESGTRLYAKMVRGDLVGPYCYGGNDKLTGVYFGWRKAGDYWFARYAWLSGQFVGFTFLKRESVDTLRGAYWISEQTSEDLTAPPAKDGVPLYLRRAEDSQFPPWATKFFEEVEKKGFPTHLIGNSL
jgi:hypothetical protein